MLKLFRKYGKWAIVAGVVLLTIGWLVESRIGSAASGSGNPVIGYIDGEKVRLQELQYAHGEMEMLGRLAGVQYSRDPLQWLLMVRDAERMGLSTSDLEVDEALRESFKATDEQKLADLATRMGTSVRGLRQALRHLMTVNKYLQLIQGSARDGSPRYSGPLLRRVLADWFSTVRVTALPVGVDTYLDKVDPATLDQQRLTDLYERYKETFPGEGEYGFGYRVPDRVKIEFIKVPMSRALSNIDVTEDEIITYYDEHREDYRPAAGTQPFSVQPPAPQDPTPSARREIVRMLREKKATELRDRVLKDAAAALSANAASLPMTNEGYRELPADFQPIPMAAVAEGLREKHGFLPTVQQYNDQWLDALGLSRIEGLGMAQLELSVQNKVPAVFYALSARELNPSKESPLIARRLQVGLPSQPVLDADGNGYIFRLTAAEPKRTPAFEEVADQVAKDARRLAAYELLIKDQDMWEQRAIKQSLPALSQDLGKPLIHTDPFPRRIDMQQGRGLEPPTLRDIGQDRAFVDQVFVLADKVNALGGPDKAAPADKIAAIPVDTKLSLFLTRVDEYHPIERDMFERAARNPYAMDMIRNSVFTGEGLRDDLSIEALKKRMKYVGEGEEENKDAATTQAAEAE